MAYNTKYSVSFNDFLGDSWKLELRWDGYSGFEYAVSGGANPVMINDPGHGDNKFTPIRGTELRAELLVNMSSTDYDFRSDFADITDREWQAVLKKDVKDSYSGSFQIDTLSITNSSVDPEGTIQITHGGALAIEPTCDFQITINEFPPVSFSMVLNAVPRDQDFNSDDGFFLGDVIVYDNDSTENVIDRLVAKYSQFTKLSQNQVRYTQDTYIDPDTLVEGTLGYYRIKDNYPFEKGVRYYDFSGDTVGQWIRVQLIMADSSGADEPDKQQIAENLYDGIESLSTIAENLADQINGFTKDRVYFPSLESALDDGVRDIELEAVVNSATPETVTVTLVGFGTDGNGIEIRDGGSLLNETYLRVIKRDGSVYTYSLANFSGGDDGGDNFTFQIDKGDGFETYAQVKGYTSGSHNTTRAQIIQSLVNKMSNDYEFIGVSVDETHSYKANTKTTEDASSWTYKFTTDGGSTVSPDESAGTDFDSATIERIKWIGWVIPGMYEQPAQKRYQLIELKAVDGLGHLKNLDFEIDDKRPFQKLTFLKVLSGALRRTGLNLNLYEAFELWPNGTSDDTTPLTQVYQDAARLSGVNCFDSGREIVKLMVAQLRQKDNRWEIIPFRKLGQAYTYRTYDYLGTKKDEISIATTDYIKDVGGLAQSNKFINRSGTLTYSSAYRKVITNQDFGFVSQLIKFPSFNRLKNNLDNAQYPWQWKYNDIIQSGFTGKISKSEGYLHIMGQDTDQSGQYYIEQEFFIANIPYGETEEKQFEFEIRFKQGQDDDQAATNLEFRVILEDGTYTRYLENSDESNPVGIDSSNISVDNKESNGDKTVSIKFDYSISILAPEGTCKVQIFQPPTYNKRISVKSVRMNINTIADSSKEMQSYYDELVDDLTAEISEQDIKLGDAPASLIGKQIYKNALFYYDVNGDLQLTQYWGEVLDSSSPPGLKRIVDWLRHFYLKEYTIPPVMLEATVFGDVELWDIIKDKTDGDRLYLLTGGEWNIRRNEIDGEWQEINISDSGYTRVDKQNLEKEATGEQSYTNQPPGDEVDLTDYVTTDQLDAAIAGKEGSFTGADLNSSRQITIYHNQNTYNPIVFLTDYNNQIIDQSNYIIDTENSNDHIIITMSIPIQDVQTINYRVL